MTMTERERLALTAFSARVQELRESPLNKTGTIKFTVNVMSDDPEKAPFEGGLPDADVKLFLLPLRQLMMKNEDIHFEKICDIVANNCGRPELIAWVEWLRARWNRVLDSAPFGLKLGGKTIDTKEALRLYYYGIFDSDANTAKFMESLSPGAHATIQLFVQRSLHTLFSLAHQLDCVTYEWLDAPGDHRVPAPPRNTTHDVLVLAPDLPRVELLAELKTQLPNQAVAEIGLRDYMLKRKCAVGLLVTLETTWVYHDTFESEAPESISLVGELPTATILRLPGGSEPVTEALLESALISWLERLATGAASALPADKEARKLVTKHILPAVAEGRVVAGVPV